VEDPNELAASAQAPAQLVLDGTSEFTDWSNYVRLYAGQGLRMQKAISMADAYIEAHRKRTAPLT
jgi:hypothetical protein